MNFAILCCLHSSTCLLASVVTIKYNFNLVTKHELRLINGQNFLSVIVKIEVIFQLYLCLIQGAL